MDKLMDLYGRRKAGGCTILAILTPSRVVATPVKPQRPPNPLSNTTIARRSARNIAVHALCKKAGVLK